MSSPQRKGSAMHTVERLEDLKPDPNNANRGTPRGHSIIERSVRQRGAGRSGLAASDGTMIAGSQTLQKMAELGIPVRTVHTNGEEWVVVVRDDIAPGSADATLLALEDNRATQVGLEWEPGVLAAIAARDDVTIDPTLFSAAEWAMAAQPALPEPGGVETEDIPDDDGVETDDLLAPFPWFGGKARVAGRVWARFGPVECYVEPFCGSAAVLLACPYSVPTRTINDSDGYVANFWRAVAADPEQVAHYADWPVNESDLFARHVWLIKRNGDLVRSLETDPDYYDAKIAGWWVWGCCAWIGTGWCSGEGPWSTEGDAIVNIRGNAGRGVNRQLPHLGDAGRGVNRKLPHLGRAYSDGQGITKRVFAADADGVGDCAAIRKNLASYIARLSDKLRRVRVACGDWARVTTESVTTRHGLTAVLLDPPYGEGAQEYSGGGNADKGIADAVWAWACANGNDPQYRIGVCGYEDGRDVPPGWTAMRWKARKGYAATDAAVENSSREVIWFSPHCLPQTIPLT